MSTTETPAPDEAPEAPETEAPEPSEPTEPDAPEVPAPEPGDPAPPDSAGEPEALAWGVPDVARLLDRSESWVRDQVAAGNLPAYGLGDRSLRFRRSEVLAWLDSRRLGVAS